MVKILIWVMASSALSFAIGILPRYLPSPRPIAVVQELPSGCENISYNDDPEEVQTTINNHTSTVLRIYIGSVPPYSESRFCWESADKICRFLFRVLLRRDCPDYGKYI
jgi:hypothetical protein